MGKWKLNHYMGLIVAFYFSLVLVIFALSVTISKQTLALGGSLLTLILFYLSNILSDRMVEVSEALQEESSEELVLKSEDAKFHVELGVGIGIGLLLGGIVGENKDYLLVAFGLTVLLLSNIAYNWSYLPRHYQLLRQATIKKMQDSKKGMS